MDELFGSGEATFARRDAELKHSIEREIGLLALLGEEENDGHVAIISAEKGKAVDEGDQEQVEKKSLGD